ncbi:hypothetical protein CcCBS67573_g09579 [Chytriomyces confervae]|uniref:Uncharacterized protein n=1 Tax=Chytriomyces confervae TaxID=246404 RepID=A0A507DT42_9FUNG|nr:hypothetical protein CcCBS67573_g09579 [Chytriomyces confervae]
MLSANREMFEGIRRKWSKKPVTPLKPPPPSLPGSNLGLGLRRFSTASSSTGSNLDTANVPVIPIAAFEIVPGAEDSDNDDDSSKSNSNSLEGGTDGDTEDTEGTENRHEPHRSGTAASSITAAKAESQDPVQNQGLNAGNTSGLFALAALISSRRGSSATVSSWLDDNEIYDEAEVRSALPCCALPQTPIEIVQSEVPIQHASAPLESEQRASATHTLQSTASLKKRVVVIALDSSDVKPLQWALDTMLQPIDLVVVMNVRPVREREASVDSKDVAHGFLKSQVLLLAQSRIPAKGLAMCGDARYEIVKTAHELGADLLVVGHQSVGLNAQTKCGDELGSVCVALQQEWVNRRKERTKGFIVISSAGNSGSTGGASFDNAEVPYYFGEGNANFKEGQLLDVVVNDLEADANNVQGDGVKIKVNATGKALLRRWGDRAVGGGSIGEPVGAVCRQLPSWSWGTETRNMKSQEYLLFFFCNEAIKR